MGRRGPPRTPTKILKIVGSTLARAREGREPQPRDADPKPQLDMTRAERHVYRQVVAHLTSMNLRAASDGNALARYAKLVVQYNSLTEFLAKHGHVYPVHQVHRDGSKTLKQMRRFPQSLQQTECAYDMLRLEREFGLTPAARASLDVEKATEENDMELKYFG